MGKASRKKSDRISGTERTVKAVARKSPGPRTARTNLIIAAVLVAAITFIVFLPALRNELLNWDDDEYVYKNPFIGSLNAKFFRSAFFGFHSCNWHPLTWISHALDYTFWGLNPMGHHLMNLVLHAFNTFLVVVLVIRLLEAYARTDDRGAGPFLSSRAIVIAGAVTGLLFGLHPLQVESVAWVSERKNLLCDLFFFSGIITYLRYAGPAGGRPVQRTSPRYSDKYYLVTLGFFVLALLSKPMAVSLPFVLLILDWYPLGRMRAPGAWRAVCAEKLPFIALSAASSVVTVLAQKAEGAIMPMTAVPLTVRLAVAAQSLVAYIGKMIAPMNLVPFYPYPKGVSLLSFGYIVPLFLVAGITVACFALVRRQRVWMAIWAYYVITLLPVLGIVQVGNQAMADRYFYLPGLGPLLLAGLLAAVLYERVKASGRSETAAGAAVIIIALALSAALSYATVKQIDVWKSSISLWTFVIEREPAGVPLAHNNLGEAYKSRGELEKAAEQYQAALRLDPDLPEARNNLANILAAKGQSDKAISEYQRALAVKPESADGHYNLGLAYDAKGQFDKAIAEYQAALKLKPDYPEAHNNLGTTYGSQGLFDKAIAEFRAAVQQRPGFLEARYNLAFTYLKANKPEMARKELEEILRIRPDFAAARQLLTELNTKKR
jgi:tetratricopeptide (TPR) repeat protein